MTMKAIVIDGYGASDRLLLREVETPRPAAGEVLIRVHAAGVNPIDWKIRRGLFRPVLWLRFPVILGCDVSGVVEAAGPGVTRFQPGDPVFGLLDPKRHGPGGYAEYAAAPESSLARKPELLSFEEAASLPVAALTALQSLRDLGRLRAGGSVLINGASGGVGTLAIPLARALGALRIAGVCGPSNVELVRSLGADPVIDYRREDFTRRPETYDVVLDAVAMSSFGACRRLLTPRGVYVTTLPMPGAVAWGAILPIAGLLGYGKRAKIVLARGRAPDLEFLARQADLGHLRPIIDRVLPLEQAREAHDYSETERARGKIVLRVV
jgi:NADPH:quinone reductase-like Zn-dependent oxidoreductase